MRTSANTPAPLLREADAMTEQVAIVRSHYATYRNIFARNGFSGSGFELRRRIAAAGARRPPQIPEEIDPGSDELGVAPGCRTAGWRELADAIRCVETGQCEQAAYAARRRSPCGLSRGIAPIESV